MKRKTINSQLTNFYTYEMYKRQLLSLAENVFEFQNMPKYIDTAYLNKTLLQNGSIAFFEDDVLGLLALPYTVLGSLDVYGRPKAIIVQAKYDDLQEKYKQRFLEGNGKEEPKPEKKVELEEKEYIDVKEI